MNDTSPKTIVNSRAELRALLQRAGMARAAADLVAQAGWSALAAPPRHDPEKDFEMSIQDLRLKRGEKTSALKNMVNKPNWNEAKDRPVYDALMAEVETIDAAIKREHDLNALMAEQSRPFAAPRESDDHARAFTALLRAPRDMRAKQNLADFDVRAAASGATDPAGGYLVPEVIVGPLMRRLVAANPFRQLVRVIQVETRDITLPLSNSDMTTGWVGEGATRTATAEPTLVAPKPTFGTLYSYVEASEELVMDSAFDIAAWFTDEAGDAMGAAEMTAIISGDGNNKPSGLLKVAPEAVADGSRTAGALKYLPTGAASTYGTDLSSLLISTIYDLKAPYRTRAAWVMNSQVAGDIRKLKDTTGRFLWSDGLAAGEPATLAGYPVHIAESMPGVAANAHPILFGDFERGYALAENGGLRVTTDDNITKPGAVKWYLRRRMGGVVYDNNAVRAIKIATT